MADKGNPGQSPSPTHVAQEQPIDQENKKVFLCEILDGCKKLFEEAEQIMVMVNQWKEENNSDTAQPTDEQRRDLIRQLQAMISNAQSIQGKLSNNGPNSTTPSDNVEAAKADEHLSDELTDHLDSSTAATHSDSHTPKGTAADSEPAMPDNLEDKKADKEDGLETDKELTDNKATSALDSQEDLFLTPKTPLSADTAAEDSAENDQRQLPIPAGSKDPKQSGEEPLVVDNDSFGNTVEQVRADEPVSDQVTDQSVSPTNQPVEPASSDNFEVEEIVKTDLNADEQPTNTDVSPTPETPLSADTAADKHQHESKSTVGSEVQDQCVEESLNSGDKPVHVQEVPNPTFQDCVIHTTQTNIGTPMTEAELQMLTKDMSYVIGEKLALCGERIETNFTSLFHAMEDIRNGKMRFEEANFPRIISTFYNEISYFDKDEYASFDPFMFAKKEKEDRKLEFEQNFIFYVVCEQFLKKRTAFERCMKDLLFFFKNKRIHSKKQVNTPLEEMFSGGYEERLLKAIDAWKSDFWNKSLQKYLAHQEERQKMKEPTGDKPTFEWRKEFPDYKKSKFFKKRADHYASLMKMMPRERVEHYNSLPENKKNASETDFRHPKIAHMKMMAEAYQILSAAPDSEVLKSDFDYLSHLHQDKLEEYEFSAFTAIFSTTIGGRLMF